MAIPDFQSILLPLLRYASNKDEVPMKEAYAEMAKDFAVSPLELQQKLPSGRAKLFYNRVAWAKQYLIYATLVEPVRHGVFRITKLGKRWAERKIKELKISDFREIPGYEDRVGGISSIDQKDDKAGSAAGGQETPEEQMQSAYKQVRQRIIAVLLERILDKPPEFFEVLVLDLMMKLGYGDGTRESLIHTGQTGDGGVDGKIKMDYLGIEHVFLQAKRNDPSNSISREQVAAFAGSITGKGVFLTTSYFTTSAVQFVRDKHPNIVLIDGQRIGELMIKTELGLNRKETLCIYTIDEDYFRNEDDLTAEN